MAVNQSRRVRAARRRKRRMDAADNDLTAAQWAAIRAAWGGCAYCGATDGAMQKDCVLPLSRGGRYTLGNVVPACRSCNASKCNEEVTHWLRRKRLDEPAFLLRFYEVRTVLVTECAGAPMVEASSDVRRYTTPKGPSVGNSPSPRPTGLPSSSAVQARVT